MTDRELYLEAIKKYGEENQIKKAVEEMAELTKELCKNNDPMHIAEEIADVEIMLEQLKLIYYCAFTVNVWRAKKLDRLKERLGK